MYKKALSGIKLVPSDPVSSSEVMEYGTSCEITVTRLALACKPDHPSTDRRFVEEFGLFAEGFSHKSDKLLPCGDFNCWIDDPPQTFCC